MAHNEDKLNEVFPEKNTIQSDQMVLCDVLNCQHGEINQGSDVLPSSPENLQELAISSSAEDVPILEDLFYAPQDNTVVLPIGPQPLSYYSPPEDVEDELAIPGVCGLKNLGNTCFMNAGLQCLLNNKHLVEYFIKNDFLDASTNTLVTIYAELVRKVWKGQHSLISPNALKELLGKHHPQFKDFRQHDCQEFLALLLDTFHEQLNFECSDKKADCKRHCNLVNSATDSLSSPSKLYEEGLKKNNNVTTVASMYGNESHDICAMKETVPSTILFSNPCTSSSIAQTSSMKSESNNLKFVNVTKSSECSAMVLTDKKQLKLKTENVLKTEKNELVAIDEMKIGRLSVLEDFVKDSKVSNTNVLVNESPNNELAFDSRKFPKFDHLNRRFSVDNLHSFPSNFVDTSSKNLKVKETNLLVDKSLKFNCMNNVVGCDQLQKQVDSAFANECSINGIKRMRLHENSGTLTNFKKFKASSISLNNCNESSVVSDDEEDAIESSDQSDDEACSVEPQDNSNLYQTDQDLIEKALAEKQWKQHLDSNKSVIVDTFLGQFKSTIVCSVCNHLSVTFEPFMYLPVPLPRAMERQFSIVFVSSSSHHTTKYVITISRNQRVMDLKKAVLSVINLPEINVILAEVSKNHVSKILDDYTSLQNVNSGDGLIYAFDIKHFSLCDNSGDDNSFYSMDYENSDASKNSICKWQTCAICLEEMLDSELLTHPPCGCVLCQNCIEISKKHYGVSNLVCPVCIKSINSENDFVPIVHSPCRDKSKARMILTPLCFRHDIRCTIRSESMYSVQSSLFGHPLLLKLPTSLNSSYLYRLIKEYSPIDEDFKIIFVDRQGTNCSRCEYSTHCNGCEIDWDEEVCLRPGDNLCVSYDVITGDQKEAFDVVHNHDSVQSLRKNKTITIYDCLEAFSESETLDELNPWFCPVCEKNQSAMKTLSVWRFPETIVIYLKRFVFQNLTSTKLDNQIEFPIRDDLVLGNFISGPGHFNNSDSSFHYELQACVSHFGGMNSGHYTSYAKHASTNEWYYFNDETVTKKQPQEDDQKNAYILFYQKKGTPLLSVSEKSYQRKEESSSKFSLMESTTRHSMEPDAIDKVLMVLEEDERKRTE